MDNPTPTNLSHNNPPKETAAPEAVQNIFEKLLEAGLARRAENTVSLFGSSRPSVMSEEGTTNLVETVCREENKQPVITPPPEQQHAEAESERMDQSEIEPLHTPAEYSTLNPEKEKSPLDEISILFEGTSSDRSYISRRRRFSNTAHLKFRTIKQEPPETIEKQQKGEPTTTMGSLADHLKIRKRFRFTANATPKINANEVGEALNRTDPRNIFEGILLFNFPGDRTSREQHTIKMEPDVESPIIQSSFAFLPESDDSSAVNRSVSEVCKYFLRPVKIENVSPRLPPIAGPKKTRRSARKEKSLPMSTSRPKRGVALFQTPTTPVEPEDMTKTVSILTERRQEETSRRDADLNRKIFIICEHLENLVGAVQQHADKNSELSKIIKEVGAKLESLDKDVKEIKETPRQAPRASRLVRDEHSTQKSASTPNTTLTQKRPRARPRLKPAGVKRKSTETDESLVIPTKSTKKSRLSARLMQIEDPANISLLAPTVKNPYGYEPVGPGEEQEYDDDDVEGLTFETFNMKDKCPFCWSPNHVADDCFRCVEERQKIAETLQLCLNCLTYHPLSVCEQVAKDCSFCGQTIHHEAMCPSEIHRVECINRQEMMCPLESRNKHGRND